jgi:arylsulfatase A-like enzyme
MVPRVPPAQAPPGASVRLLADTGAVMVGLALLVGFEVMLVGTADRAFFTGNWEIVQTRRLVAPIALAMLAPAAVALALVGRLVGRAMFEVRAGLALAGGCGLAAGLLAYGVSSGRHMQAPAVRLPFMALLSVVGAALGYAAPWLLEKLSARAVATAAFFVAASAWMADLGFLPRLYPAFHAGLFVLLLASVATLAGVLARGRPYGESRIALGFVFVVAGLCIGWMPAAARRLRLADNLRFVLVERTVVLRRAVELAAWVAPPAPLDESPDTASAPVGEIPRALDWSGHDLLLISVDALRADHVSAYGYGRPTTPNLDALAHEGAVFESAYCPTPHTSYSVTSMMTGKAMRPLMTLGLGGGSETWAAQLQRYGYRTAAFYPPAVFYIDAERFGAFEASRLDFEYAKVQFSSAEERVTEVAQYLASAPPSPVFLWVHLFEPHEPYVMHPSYAYGGRGLRSSDKPIDAYDSEVAYADAAIGRLVTLVREKRPGVAIVVTSDHGEEFGEHGGRYHGTTCYEEQVRVPLVVVGPGVRPRRIPTVVETIDLLPTVLSALGTPRPARVQGRDLGPILAGTVGNEDLGLAYAETDDYAMVARGNYRLLCQRRVAACRLFDLANDPSERVDMTASRPQNASDLRAILAGIEREAGRYEAGATPWPDPIRRGLLHDADAALDAAALLDDASAAIRRKAGEVMFVLHVAELEPQTRRALARDEDTEVQKWCALALVRMGDRPSAQAEGTLRDTDLAWRRRAALAFASRGDARGAGELAAYWRDEAPPHGGLDMEDARELLLALGRLKVADAVPALVGSLPFVPLRPLIADALGAIGDDRARAPLLELFADERYETARPHEARALLALGARRELRPSLERFAGLPEPMIDAVAVARDARLLDPAAGGVSLDRPAPELQARLAIPSGSPLRLLVLAAGEGGELSGSVDGEALGSGIEAGGVHIRELPAAVSSRRIDLRLREPRGILGAWIVPRAEPPFDLRAADK